MKFLFILFFIIIFLAACSTKYGSGNVVTQSRQVDDFTTVEVSGPFTVEIKQGALQPIKVVADDNVIGDIICTVDDGELKIKMKGNMNVNDASLKIYISAPGINSVDASGAASVDIISLTATGGNISLESSSAASIKAVLDAPEISLDANSGASITAHGNCRSVNVDASSGSTINAAELHSETATVDGGSGASINVFASILITGKAGSGSSIKYSGKPKSTVETSSGASVRSVE